MDCFPNFADRRGTKYSIDRRILYVSYDREVHYAGSLHGTMHCGRGQQVSERLFGTGSQMPAVDA